MDTTETDLIVRLTDCDPATAERVLAALLDRGWRRPDPVITNDGNCAPMTGAGALCVYTDGACSGNPGPGGWATVFVRNGMVLSESSGGAARTTNNEMELMAVLNAVRLAPAEARLEILTDSQLVIGWLDQGFKRNKPHIAALCGEIEAVARERPGGWSFRKVKGHAGDSFNSRADSLAVAACKGVQTGAA